MFFGVINLSTRKHYKKNSKKISKKKIFFLILILFILVLFIKSIFSDSTEEEIASSDDSNIDSETVIAEVEIEEEEEIEFSEDEGIAELINSYILENNLTESNFAFFYYNVDTRKEYFYNEMTQFTAASTVKLPVAMLYYDQINDGTLSSTDTLLYSSSSYEAGGGLTASYYSPGDYVPISFLLQQSIVNSDNTAINILMSYYGYINCRQQINQKYTTEEVDDSFFQSNLTYAKYAFEILDYLYTNIDDYTDLIEDLKVSSDGLYLKKYIDDYDVAHKYGSYNGYVHDYGIVFGESTYLIGVYTKNVTDAAELIADISLDVLNYTLEEE